MIKMAHLKKIPLNVSAGFFAVIFSMLVVPASTVEGAIVFFDDFENGGLITTTNSGADGSWVAPLSQWSVTPVGSVLGCDQYSFNASTYLPPYSGKIAAAFVSATNDGTVATGAMSASISTTPSQTYNLHFWISNPTPDLNARQNLFSLSWDNHYLDLTSYSPTPNFFSLHTAPGDLPGTADQYVVKPNTNWFEIFVTNLTPNQFGSSTSLKFEGQNNNWATLVDNVLVEETPEPSTVVMLGAGAVMMGLRRKRQQKSAQS